MTERLGPFPLAPKMHWRVGAQVVVRLEMSEELRQQKKTVLWDFFYSGVYQGGRGTRSRVRFPCLLAPLYDNCLHDPNADKKEPVYLVPNTDVWTLAELWTVQKEIYLDGHLRPRIERRNSPQYNKYQALGL